MESRGSLERQSKQLVPLPSAGGHPPRIGENVCPGCGDFDPWSAESAPAFYGIVSSGVKTFVHQIRRDVILQCSRNGCLGCQVLGAALLINRGPNESKDDLMKIRISANPGSRGLIVGHHKKDRIEIFAPPGPPDPEKPALWPAFGAMPCISRSSSEEKCLELIRTWLNDCRESHRECASNSHVTLPKRVIDVGDDATEPRLVITGGRQGEYLTLSYCWGKTNQGITIKSNVADRVNILPLGSLCETHRDGILIARKLGIKYLWIDAICIVQDDRTDWDEESSKMFSIYRDSALTIAASTASDGDGGIFSDRPLGVLAKAAIILDLKFPDNDSLTESDEGAKVNVLISGYNSDPDTSENIIPTSALIEDAKGFNGPFILLRKPVLSHHIYSYGFHNSNTAAEFPLEDRAWCFQERILSTRIVHFARDEMVWECKSSRKCECGGMPSREGQITLREQFEVFLADQDPQKRSDTWMELVSKCSKRKISRESDRLPTLSGLARCLQQQGFGDYLAGLWKEFLPGQLLWSTYGGNEAQRAEPYRAPTWSFASLENASVNNALETLGRSRRDFLASLVSAACTPGGLDPTGNAVDGQMTLNGPIQDTFLEYRFIWRGNALVNRVRYGVVTLGKFHEIIPDYHLFDPTHNATYKTDQAENHKDSKSTREEDQNLIPLVPDETGDLKPIPGTPVVLMAICNERQLQWRSHGRGVETLFCLVLRLQTGAAEGVRNAGLCYERIGLLKLDQEDEPKQWLEGASLATLTIV